MLQNFPVHRYFLSVWDCKLQRWPWRDEHVPRPLATCYYLKSDGDPIFDQAGAAVVGESMYVCPADCRSPGARRSPHSISIILRWTNINISIISRWTNIYISIISRGTNINISIISGNISTSLSLLLHSISIISRRINANTSISFSHSIKICLLARVP